MASLCICKEKENKHVQEALELSHRYFVVSGFAAAAASPRVAVKVALCLVAQGHMERAGSSIFTAG